MSEFLEAAFVLAQKAESEDEVPVGAVVVLDGKIVGRGYNQRENSKNPVAHAEILALQDAAAHLESWRLLNCQLFVTLEPCPMCLAACQQARVSEVIFGTYDAKGGALSLGYKLHEDSRTNHRFHVTLVEHEGSKKILKEYFAEKRNGLTR
jgi:tRNA(adenine34) deaminase